MGRNAPRMEFRPGPAMRAKIDQLRLELSTRAGRKLSNSQVIKAILEEFFDKKEPKSS